MDVTAVAVFGVVVLFVIVVLIFAQQNKRLVEALENNTKAINSTRDVMVHINSSQGMHEKLLVTILDKLNK